MIKAETEQEDLRYSVDPHLVQPTLEDLLIEKRLVNQEDAQSLSIVDGSVRMEHCINLDLFLAPIDDVMEPCFTDELNTPDTFVSEARNDFKKSINTTTATMHLKQSDGNPFNFSAEATQPATASVNFTEENKINYTHTFSSKIIMSPAMHSSISYDWQYGDDVTAECGGLLSPNRFDIDMEDINLSEYDFLHDCQDAIDADNACNVMDNNSTSSTFDEHHNYALKLNIDNNLPNLAQMCDVLETPDIISTILQYENSENVMEPCQVSFLTAEEIKKELDSSTSEPSPQPATPETTYTHDDENSIHSIASSSAANSSATVVRRTRRRKRDSDDEDYVPPIKSSRRALTKRRVKVEFEDFEDEDSAEEKPPRRGRPAKPVSARSSESSECSKYREMRDKNNEASRRSRRKRRLQEQNVELECETLNEKNVRLKAQVGELERSVASYRNNLMSLLLKKA